jgi:hypothetical protein
MATRIRELAVQAASDTYSETQREHLNEEAQALVREVDRIENPQNTMDRNYSPHEKRMKSSQFLLAMTAGLKLIFI